MRTRIARNLSWLVAGRAFRAVVSLSVGVLVARYLGPEGFGLLSFALAFVFFFGFLVDLGLRQVLVRELTRNAGEADEILGTAFLMKLFGGLSGFALLWITVVLAEPLGPGNNALFLVIGASLGFQSLQVINSYFQSRVLSGYVVTAQSAALLVSSLLKVLFVVQGRDVVWFALAGTVDVALYAMFLLLAFRKVGGRVSTWRPNFRRARALFAYAWPLLVTALLVAVHHRIDQLMIGALLNSSEVGFYSVAVKVSEFWYFIPTMIATSVTPYLVQLREQDTNAYRRRLVQLYSAMFWGSALLGLVVWLYGEPVLVLVFGEAYRPAYAALVINIWAGIFVAQGVARNVWVVTENLQKYRLYNNVFAVVVNILGNLLLIPRMGIAGAALATLASQGLSLWVFSLTFKPFRQSTLDLIRSINPFALKFRRAG